MNDRAVTPLPTDDILDLLRSLVDKSLVVYEEHDGVGRYRLLETVKQYAEERLTEIGAGKEVFGRHQQYFLELAEHTAPLLRGPEQGVWLAHLETEHDNLRVALAWCEQQAEEAEAGLRLAGALWQFWNTRGHLLEGRQWLKRALEKTKQDATEPEASMARALALNRAGRLAYSQSDYVAARTLFEESLTIRRRLGDQKKVANSLDLLGEVAESQGDYTTARTLHEESLTIRRTI